MNISNNFGFKHKSGILLPIFSLPNKYGIGSLGKEAYKFVDFLYETKQKVWQVLPLNPTSYGDSPYQSPSTFAGNPYFIDLEMLVDDGLLKKKELKEFVADSKIIEYGILFESRYKILRLAFSRFIKGMEYHNFLSDNLYWIDDYALFMAFKTKNNNNIFTSWDNKEKNYLIAKQIAFDSKFINEMNFWKFLQFKFYQQWNRLLKYAHSKDILLMGDMPIYVAYDSVDVWSKSEMFNLNSNLEPNTVAGCPPDAFSDDGQLWGNPIYNWKYLKSTNYLWWIERFKHYKKMFDLIRIDHFRAFSGYYEIPYGDINAKNGFWTDGPRMDLFNIIKKNVKQLKIVAEDLGYITKDVRDLIKTTGYPGMKVLQFAFDSEKNEYLPKNYKSENCVVYTGTHDNDTGLSFTQKLRGKSLNIFLNNCNNTLFDNKLDQLIYACMNSKANLCIIPFGDYLKLNSKGRINTPSTAINNWTFKLKDNYYSSILINKIKKFTEITNRS